MRLAKLTLASLLALVPVANAEPVHDDNRGLATADRWGGGVRLTGLSGIGALPGVNFGAEVALNVRRDEVFAELGLARWQPEEDYAVVENPQQRVDLKLDLWTLRAGWASMDMPLRAWLLLEVGEIAGARGMQGVVSRMVMGETPGSRQWKAAGGGFGVAWPMSDQARLFGSLEIAIPMDREPVMLDRRGAFTPDPFVARTTVGIEVGWR
ncbi:MAG: hypothetical protein M4D80_23450 [Myxococcota bacterium]|nr:hypothetical protein [Myxococcota bacterium]